MAKKIVCCVLILGLLTLPSFALDDSPEPIPDTAQSMWTLPIFWSYQDASVSTDWLSVQDPSNEFFSQSVFIPNADNNRFKVRATCLISDKIYPDNNYDTLFKDGFTYHVTLGIYCDQTPFHTRSLSASFWNYNGYSLPNNQFITSSLGRYTSQSSISYEMINGNEGYIHFVFRCSDPDGRMSKYGINSVVIEFAMQNYSSFYLLSNRTQCYYDVDGTAYNELVLDQFNKTNENLNDIKDEISQGNKLTEEQNKKLDVVNDNLQTIDQSVIDGNQQAHEDHEDMKDFMQEMQDKEKQEVEENGDSSDSEALVNDKLSFSAFADTLGKLSNSLLYSGTDVNWTFPALDVPYLGHLSDPMKIDFSYYYERLPSVVKVCAKFMCLFVCVGVCMKNIQEFLVILNGQINGGDDD